ncbi:hypothetical protein A3467_07160 [Enterobacter roggenkampii]|nr:hypothetical protein A3467_07160 [Enterobacter roggenkampii]
MNTTTTAILSLLNQWGIWFFDLDDSQCLSHPTKKVVAYLCSFSCDSTRLRVKLAANKVYWSAKQHGQNKYMLIKKFLPSILCKIFAEHITIFINHLS